MKKNKEEGWKYWSVAILFIVLYGWPVLLLQLMGILGEKCERLGNWLQYDCPIYYAVGRWLSDKMLGWVEDEETLKAHKEWDDFK